MAADLGSDRVHDICTKYAADNPGFTVPQSIVDKKLVDFYRNLEVTREGEIAVVVIRRPEVMNALNEQEFGGRKLIVNFARERRRF